MNEDMKEVDTERLKLEQAKKDLSFLREMKERLEKGRDNNDRRDEMLLIMIENWIAELEEFNEVQAGSASKRNWFEKLPLHWRLLYYFIGGIVVALILNVLLN